MLRAGQGIGRGRYCARRALAEIDATILPLRTASADGVSAARLQKWKEYFATRRARLRDLRNSGAACTIRCTNRRNRPRRNGKFREQLRGIGIRGERR